MNRAFTHGFSTFLRRRRATWYFERRPLLGGLTAALKLAPPQGARVPPGLGEDLLAAAREERKRVAITPCGVTGRRV